MSDNTAAIGRQLAELCRQGKNIEAIEQLYSPNIVSIEAMSMPEMPARMEGVDAIRGKNQWWIENHEVHGCDIAGPFPHGDRFALVFKIDVTFKPSGQRMQMEEVCLYTVADGKIVQEEFFYDCEDS